ncbi:hypothetical protein KC939_02850 [Candidatus Saccharibacteria bacterium]|nr:hypothetical protein [Candidatus Saccharibacteria bacterium]
MKQIKAVLPPKLKNKHAQFFAWFLGLIFLLMALVQLVKFEKFTPFIESVFDGGAAGKAIAAIIVTTEVFALPFLLRMALSPLMRFCSMVCGWLAALTWLWISLTYASELIGLSFSLVILAGYVSYLLRGDISRLQHKR